MHREPVFGQGLAHHLGDEDLVLDHEDGGNPAMVFLTHADDPTLRNAPGPETPTGLYVSNLSKI